MNKQPSKARMPEEAGFFEPYTHYARTLRTWFVAYGIGGPAIIITHPDTLATVAKAGHVGLIGWLFLVGAGAQVLLALLNKISMWYLYYAEIEVGFKERFPFKLAEWFSYQFWVDIMIDIVTVLGFTASTILLFDAFTKSVTAH